MNDFFLKIKGNYYYQLSIVLVAILIFLLFRFLRYKTDVIVQEEEKPSTTDVALAAIPTIIPGSIDTGGLNIELPVEIVTTDLPTPTVLPPLPLSPYIPSFCPQNYAIIAGTDNFKISEFHCNDGTEVPNEFRGNLQILMQQLEIIRAESGGRAITVSSGYRSPTWNEIQGGASKSKHLCSTAADIKISGMSASEAHALIKRLINEGKIIGGGLGKYKTFTHYDTGKRRDWDYS